VVAFGIILVNGLADSAGEADRLARKHKFSIDHRYEVRGEYSLGVAWLEPEQVAALRCERSVSGIDFISEVSVTSTDVVVPNISLELTG
jgi:hypothetical protein